ncbi:recombinase family protein [Enterococcus hirae]|nr:recombinase family protein [Enterococcus hirae]
MKRVALYIRVSTPEQEKHGYSIQAQTEKLTAYAKAKDYSIYKIYTDAAQSGSKLERPALQEMIEDIENKKIDVVIVYKLDRLSRSQKNTMYLIEDIFLKNNVDFISMQESFDTTTSFGRAMIGILSVFAQLERDNITERMTMGRLERVKKGYYMGGGNIPFGYKYNELSNVLEPVEPQASLIKRMFKLASLEKSMTGIANVLLEEYPQFKTSINDTTIRRRLVNPVYLGQQKFNGEYHSAKHQSIISEEMFYKVQNILATRAHGNAFKRSYLLSGLIYCGVCGNRYSAYENQSKHNGIIYKNKYYRCNARTWKYKKKTGHSCSNRSIKCEELEKHVIEIVKNYAYSYEKKKQKQMINIEPLKQEIKKLQIKQSKLLDMYLADKLNTDLYENKNEELDSHIKELQKQLERLQIKKAKEDIEAPIQIIKNTDFDHSTPEKIKKLLHSVIARIEVTPTDILVFFYNS